MKTAAHDAPTQEKTTMQAIVQDRYGEAGDVLRLEETGRPAIGDDQVLLRVHAAGVDRGVWHLMTGLPYPVRLAGYGVRAPKTRVRGREVAGRVEAMGKGVTSFQVALMVVGYALLELALVVQAVPILIAEGALLLSLAWPRGGQAPQAEPGRALSRVAR